jgi:uncharacterized protein (TIGR02391 family)
VFEATKGLAERIRSMTGLTGDGATLADQALAVGKTGIPALAINTLQTDTERSEQNGLANLAKGVFGMFRNTTTHAPKITWNITEPDALDLFTTLSLGLPLVEPAQRGPPRKGTSADEYGYQHQPKPPKLRQVRISAPEDPCRL